MELRRSYVLRFRGEDIRTTVVRSSSGEIWVETESGDRIEDAIVLDSGRTVSIRRDGRMDLIDLTPPDAPDTRALVNGKGGRVLLLDELSAAAAKAAKAGDARELHATMPGLVVAVSVELGQAVEEGESLVVLEAMKMQNDLPSPSNGVVAEILCKPGESVDSGQLLIRLDPPSSVGKT
ncbi:MAG TPA: biotin/lipoyl-containing protein [Candidatus Krumholzibacteria bacterium]|jgi:biotin carboxyl carrier protein